MTYSTSISKTILGNKMQRISYRKSSAIIFVVLEVRSIIGIELLQKKTAKVILYIFCEFVHNKLLSVCHLPQVAFGQNIFSLNNYFGYRLLTKSQMLAILPIVLLENYTLNDSAFDHFDRFSLLFQLFKLPQNHSSKPSAKYTKVSGLDMTYCSFRPSQ